MSPDLVETMDNISQELKRLLDTKFTGNIQFQVNLKFGEISSINCGLNKSIKIGGAYVEKN